MAAKAEDDRDEAEVHLLAASQDLQEAVDESPIRKRGVVKAVSSLGQAWDKPGQDYALLSGKHDYIKDSGVPQRW